MHFGEATEDRQGFNNRKIKRFKQGGKRVDSLLSILGMVFEYSAVFKLITNRFDIKSFTENNRIVPGDFFLYQESAQLCQQVEH